MSEKATHPRIDPQLYRLRDALKQSQVSGLMGNILGAFPDDPEVWERITARHGRMINRHLQAIANVIVTDLAQAGQLPITERKEPKFKGHLLHRMGVSA